MVMVAVSLLARLVPTPQWRLGLVPTTPQWRLGLVSTPPLGVALGLAPSSRPVPTTPLGPPWPIWWVAVRLTLPAALLLLD